MSNDTAVDSRSGLHNAKTSSLSFGVRLVGDNVGVNEGEDDGVDVGEAVVAITVPHSARRVLDVVVVMLTSGLALTVVTKAAVVSRDVNKDFIIAVS